MPPPPRSAVFAADDCLNVQAGDATTHDRDLHWFSSATSPAGESKAARSFGEDADAAPGRAVAREGVPPSDRGLRSLVGPLWGGFRAQPLTAEAGTHGTHETKTLSCVLFLLPDRLTRENCVPASLRPCVPAPYAWSPPLARLTAWRPGCRATGVAGCLRGALALQGRWHGDGWVPSSNYSGVPRSRRIHRWLPDLPKVTSTPNVRRAGPILRKFEESSLAVL